MLHSDTLAQEFNEILNGAEIFAPFQPLDPAIVFYAPLRNNVRDLRLNPDDFQRSSDAWYKDGSGIYRHVGINVPRFEESRYLMEPAGTNVHECYSANPDAALSGWSTVSLSPGAVFERVQDVAELAAAGLQDICHSGFVFRIDNRAASGSSYVLSAGLISDGANVLSTLYWHGDGSGRNRLGGQAGTLEPLPARYERNVQQWGSVAGNQRHRIEVDAGGDLYFILPDLQDAPIATSPIITEGTAGQRAIDISAWLEDGWFPHAEGMAVLDWFPGWNRVDGAGGQQGLLNVRASAIGLIYHDRNTLKTYDGVNNPVVTMPDFLAGERLRAVSRWNASELDIGFWYNGGWTWNVPTAYDGSFLSDGELIAGFQIIQPSKLSDIAIYDTDYGRQWVEDNLTPS